MTTGDLLNMRETLHGGVFPHPSRHGALWLARGAGAILPVLWVLALLSLCTGARAANEVEFRAEVDRETVAMDETVTLTVTLSGNLSQVPGIDLGDVPDFDVIPRGHRQQMSVVNGEMALTSIQEFELRPKKIGDLQIPALQITVDGRTVSTQPIGVTVVKATEQTGSVGADPGGDAAPSTGAEVELQASASPSQVYVGQQLTYRLRVLRRVNWQSPSLDNVKFDGFWVEELNTASNERRTTLGNQVYLYQDLVYALFPSAAGPQELPPRTLSYARMTSNDFFFSMAQPAPPVKSNAVAVTVLPIPEEGRPAGYGGAVGTLDLTARVEPAQIRQDQAVTLTLIVSGVGNPQTFPQPALDLPAGFETFETKTDVYVNKKRELLSGTRTFKTVLVPRVAGDFKLGPFGFWAFDPAQKAFVHVVSEAVEVHVDKGTGTAAPATASGPKQEDLRLLGEDIRYLKPIDRVEVYERPMHARFGFWILFAIPLVALGLAEVARRHQSRLASDVAFRRRRQALRTAQERLEAARKTSDQNEQYRLLELCLTGFMADWFNLSASGTSREQFEQQLSQASAESSVSKRVREYLDECAYLRFAQAGQSNGASEQMFGRAKGLLAELQKEVGMR